MYSPAPQDMHSQKGSQGYQDSDNQRKCFRGAALLRWGNQPLDREKTGGAHT
ncbi:unnamed protein product [Staurois parvus]|uniref:Uncharacterized protein n=1 Tax=Staurois parvus TaxID=386267 RepID=A0ABN9D6L3_9NEOB|nr:unnamed protein product [Staurois parvus]